jgi:DNA polymerase-1
MPIQGTGADIIKVAMLRLHERLSTEFKNAFLVNMIHDSLAVECQASDANSVASVIKDEMETAERLLLPEVAPKADVSIVIS